MRDRKAMKLIYVDHKGTCTRNELRWLFGTLAATFLILCFCVEYGRYRFGSVSAALTYLKGRRIHIDQETKSFGDCLTGGISSVQYSVRNISGRKVRLFGVRTSCSCALVGDLPKVIENNQAITVKVLIAAPRKPADISGSVDIYTDLPQHPALKLGYTGRAVDAHEVKSYLNK